MLIALAQMAPITGSIALNSKRHLLLIEKAADAGADLIVFPELSLTGYEPELAQELAMQSNDPWILKLAAHSRLHKLIVVAGMPLAKEESIQIGLTILEPDQDLRIYSKQYLHTDEVPFFQQGIQQEYILFGDERIALAICYEVFVEDHLHKAAPGSTIYLASVAKSAAGMQRAMKRMPGIAVKQQIPCLLVNAVGPCDNFIAAGGSAIWNRHGNLLAQLNQDEEALLCWNSKTDETQIIPV